MSVYVDPLFVGVETDAQARRVGARNGNRWSHMWCDAGGEDALHSMASRLGLKRSWFQDKARFPHYDLTPGRRAVAIRLGVLEKSLREWLQERRSCNGGGR